MKLFQVAFLKDNKARLADIPIFSTKANTPALLEDLIEMRLEKRYGTVNKFEIVKEYKYDN